MAADPSDATPGALLEFLIKNRRPGQSVQEAAAIIQDFSTRDSALGAQSLALGLRTGYMNPDKRGEWIEKLRAHPFVDTPGRLLADSAAVAANPESSAQIAAGLVDFVKTKPLAERALASQWLTARGESAQALTLLTLDEAITRPDAFIAWLDANAASKNWTESLAALEQPDNPLPAHISKLFLGLSRKQLNRPAESRAAFLEAIQEAGNDPAKFAEVTTYLLGTDDTGLFEANVTKAAAQPALSPVLLAKCQPAVLARHRILLGRPAPLDFLRHDNEKNPSNLSNFATLAFAELQAGRPQAAMELFDKYGPDVDARSLPRASFASSPPRSPRTEKPTSPSKWSASCPPSPSLSRRWIF